MTDQVDNGAAAFFDLDRTLIAGASTMVFGWVAWRNDLTSTREMMSDALRTVEFRLTGGSDEMTDLVRDRILEAVEGRNREDVTALNDEILPRLLSAVRPETRAVVERHHEAGRETYIVSASPVELVSPLAQALGMTGAIATESEVVDGRYTGRLSSEFCYGIGKVNRVRKLADEKGYDLRLCYAYSDSSSDLPLLELVGHPVAVNPDRTLARTARERNWPIVVFARRTKATLTAVSSAAGAAAIGAGMYALGRRHGRAIGAVS
ncbi:MAG: HAD-IB family hydrolase [Acidimicrobiia bacterium]|nr:HAD-IB family hydrolase [Acidimicrobiia bacterium]